MKFAPAALVVLWSSGFVGAELVARAGADPLAVLAWRFLALSTVLVVAQVALRRPWPSRRTWTRQAVLAVLCQAVYLGLVFEGVSAGVPGGTASLIAAVQPLLVAAVAGPVLGEHATWRSWLGLAVGLGGVALVVGGDVGVAGAPAWAYLLPVVAMLSLGGGTVLERRLRPDDDLFSTLLVQAVVTMVVLGAVAVLAGRAAPAADLGFWRAVAWLTVLSSLGGYLMYVTVARSRGATVVSTLLYLTPPTTMLWVFVMFGEPVPRLGLVGLAVSAVGVALALHGRRRASARRTGADPLPAAAAAAPRTDRI